MPGAIFQDNNRALITPSGAYGVDNLVPENIKSGVNIGGIVGAMEGPIGDLSEYTWSQIYQIVRNDKVPQKWIGQTKTFLGTDNNIYTLRFVDNTAGRYQFDDNTYSKGVFELVELIDRKLYYYSSGAAWYIYKPGVINETTNSFYYEIFPNEILSLLKPTIVRICLPNTANTGSAATKLLIPCLFEIANPINIDTNYISNATVKDLFRETNGFEGNFCCEVFDYYKRHNIPDDLIKHVVGTDTGVYYLTRTTRPGYYNGMCISSAGNITQANSGSSGSHYIALCFAI